MTARQLRAWSLHTTRARLKGVVSISRVNEIPSKLLTAKNREIMEFLCDKYCHSDIVLNIEKVLLGYPEVKAFCPDGKSFKYCFWYVGATVFACAHGMIYVWLRLPQPQSNKY